MTYTKLSGDVLEHIASEFLYYEDSFHMCCAFVKLKPPKVHFESNKTPSHKYIKIIDREHIESYNFETYNLETKNQSWWISKKIKIRFLKTDGTFNTDLSTIFENIRSSVHFSITTGSQFNQPLPINLSDSIKVIDIGSNTYTHSLPKILPRSLRRLFIRSPRYTHPLPLDLPNIKYLSFNPNFKLSDNLPDSLEYIFLENHHFAFPKKLPKSLKMISISNKYDPYITFNFIHIKENEIKFQYHDHALGILTCTYDYKQKWSSSEHKNNMVEKMSTRSMESIESFLSIDVRKLKVERG